MILDKSVDLRDLFDVEVEPLVGVVAVSRWPPDVLAASWGADVSEFPLRPDLLDGDEAESVFWDFEFRDGEDVAASS